MQPNALTVQEVVNTALDNVLRSKHEIVGSGRTDTGVHAREQVFHADIADNTALDNLQHKLNGILPPDIAVNEIRKVNNGVHARFDAVSRSYEYHIHHVKYPFSRNESYFMPSALDYGNMNKAARLLIGDHNFQSFSKVKTEVNNFNCEVTRAEWVSEKDRAVFYITANRFLRGMVRALVGTLLEIGQGKLPAADLQKIMDAKDRTVAGRAVSPDGLYLCRINYPESIFKD
jgi:tRNA pseudouridine38-40 synthase